MGFTILEIKAPMSPKAGSGTESVLIVFNFIIWGVSL